MSEKLYGELRVELANLPIKKLSKTSFRYSWTKPLSSFVTFQFQFSMRSLVVCVHII